MTVRIEHISEVLPHIHGRSDFVVAQRDGYTVIDYTYTALDTFDHPVRIECRGLKFAPDGKLIARPLSKFFNIGERADTQPNLIDFAQPHWILPKLDGSMIHPCIVNGDLRLMTRMGWTTTAMACEALHLDRVSEWCRMALDAGHTPIFEWISPSNRIVIRYPDSKLVLLAVRETVSGLYLDPATVRANALRAGLDVVDTVPSWGGDTRSFLEHVAPIKDAEGFIVRFAHGRWLKVKADDYVLKHKAKDSIVREKNVIAFILNDALDDVMPLLSEADATAVSNYRDALWRGIQTTAAEIADVVAAGAHLDQKTFAIEHVVSLPKERRAIAFRVRKGEAASCVVRDVIINNVGSQTDVDRMRVLHGATWNEPTAA